MWIVLWIFCGLIASGWMLREEWETNDGLSVGDLLIAVVITLAGPVVLVIGSLAAFHGWLEKNGSRIVIKRRKYDI